ncbi:MAG: nucleotidyltransferase family protein [Deltaproteobacteria bacterium]|nr:nucleotidyltransferase family protein [Deltaproteobacteria bacterium]
MEDRLLSQCVGDKIPEAIPAGIDWARLGEKLKGERLAPLFHSWIGRSPKALSSVPENFLEELKKSCYLTALRNTRMKEEMKSLLRLLTEQNIPVILHKGIHQAETLYGDISLRPMDDADFLIRHEDFDRVQTLLQPLKFSTLLPDWHTDILNTKRFGMVQTGPSRRILGMWQRARTIQYEGIPARTLSPEDQLIALCIHLAFNHRLEGLIWHADLVRFLKRYRDDIDWNRATQLAVEYENAKSVYYCLKYLGDKWNANIPPDILAALKPKRPGWLEKKMVSLLWKGKNVGKWDYFFSLGLLEGKKTRRRYFWLTAKDLSKKILKRSKEFAA